MSASHAPRAVNWHTGMLLTPEQFLAQDDYVEASVGWLLRYCVTGTGLVGGGVRLDESQRGLARHDPRLEIFDDGESVRVVVIEARGITPSGAVVEVSGGQVVRGEFRKADLAGFTEVEVYLVRDAGSEEDPSSIGADPANPNAAALRRPALRVTLGADAAARAVIVGRLKRASETLAFEFDGRFIPPCATVLAHSAMYAGWARVQSEVAFLAGAFAELHHAAARWTEQVEQRGVDTRDDREILAFVERAVLALDGCAYEILDPAVSPEHLFLQVERAARRVAIALDISSATQHFFAALSGADAGYAALLEEERRLLTRGREWRPREELRYSLERADQTLTRMRSLFEALEGKYVDYRVNRSLGSLRFLLDRGGEHFYIAVATPGYPQRDGDVLTLVFSSMSLTGHHEYRVVLLGDPQGISDWRLGEELRVNLRVNAGAGLAHPFSRAVVCEIPGQRNFAVNFETPPDAATLSGLQVTVQPGHGIRGAVLYQRRLAWASDALSSPAPQVEPSPSRVATSSRHP